MLVNKKLGRFKQWAGERMGGEVKTNTTDDFKALEHEMTLRHEGMEKLHRSTAAYVKSISRKNEANDRDKSSPVGHLGTTMISHGEDFEQDSEYGNYLISFGRANERIGRIQESYAAQATSTWLDTLERSLVQMKEYQAARKKLEARRLAYDTSLTKMEKAKREDFRVEEELRSQKAKYEESSEDVQRRMEDIKEAELDSVTGLSAFLEEELAYHSRCKEILVQLKRDWPATSSVDSETKLQRRGNRSRSNTNHSQSDRLSTLQDEQAQEPKIATRNRRKASNPSSGTPSPTRDTLAHGHKLNRNVTWQNDDHDLSDRSTRDVSPPIRSKSGRTATDVDAVQATRSQLRSMRRTDNPKDIFGEYDSSIEHSSSPERSGTDYSASPATSHGSVPSRSTWSTTNGHTSNTPKKAPPPPPPSRSKKPPPPPMKRSALSSSAVPFA